MLGPTGSSFLIAVHVFGRAVLMLACTMVRGLAVASYFACCSAFKCCPSQAPKNTTHVPCVDKHAQCPRLKAQFDKAGLDCFYSDVGKETGSSEQLGKRLVDECCKLGLRTKFPWVTVGPGRLTAFCCTYIITVLQFVYTWLILLLYRRLGPTVTVLVR